MANELPSGRNEPEIGFGVIRVNPSESNLIKVIGGGGVSYVRPGRLSLYRKRTH